MTIQNANIMATAWELAAFSFRYPTIELAQTVASGEWADAVEELAGLLGVNLSEEVAAELRANVGEEPEALLPKLRSDATRLFVGSPEPVSSPYEGVWRAGDDGVQALLFVNPHSMAVERFCRACGLGQPEGTNEPLDHVATECELLEYLTAISCGVMEAPAAPAAEEFPGGSYEAAFDLFLREHVLVWMPRFAEKTIAEARQPFFRAAGAFLAELLKIYA